MLLLVTLLLVVASAILLVLGFVRDVLGLIYLSMVCAGVAALALIVFARLARRRSIALAGAGPGGFGGGAMREPPQAQISPEPRRAAAPSGVAQAAPEVGDGEPGPAAEPGGAGAAPGEDGAWGEAGQWSDWGDEVVFPIEDYDELRVAEVLPLLSQLEPDELRDVRDREAAGKARTTILGRIDELTGASGRPARSRSPGAGRKASSGAAAEAKPAGPRAASDPAGAAKAPAARKAPARKAAAGAAAPAAAKKAAPRRRPAKKAGQQAQGSVAAEQELAAAATPGQEPEAPGQQTTEQEPASREPASQEPAAQEADG